MPTFRYRYSPGTPAVPSVLLNLAHPVTGQRVENVAALADTGADQTVIPERVVEALGLLQLDQEVVRGFDGGSQILPTYLVQLQIRDLTPVEVEVIASGRVPNAVVGRDVLNRYTIVLDGPGLVLSISDESG
jgi:predicted aspartyl protease